VFLHVGLPKSGTSYLQKLLIANREPLAKESRVLFPGATWNDQVVAVRDVRNLYSPRTRRRVEGSWQRLVDEVLAWRGDAVISMEWLCAANDEQIARIVESFDNREVHVVVTARDLARTLPAAWQEFMQNRQTWTWDEFLAGVQDPAGTSTGGGAFWSQQHLPRLLERWCRHLDVARVHLVTLPQPGGDRDLLWHRFAGVLGVDPYVCDTHDLGGNESLGLESAELMRRLNLKLDGAGVRRGGYNAFFKHRLAKEVLAARRSEESAVALTDETRSWIDVTAERHIELVAALGVDVVGDLDELRPGAPRPGRSPSEISDTELLDVALDALVRLEATEKTDDRASDVAASTPTPAAGAPGTGRSAWPGVGLLAWARGRRRRDG
jgi:hypothetical protein